MIAATERPGVSIDTIQRYVAAYYDVPMVDLLSRRRSATVLLARQVAIYLARHLTALSLPQIAQCFEKKDSRFIAETVRNVGTRSDRDGHLEREIASLWFRLDPARRVSA